MYEMESEPLPSFLITSSDNADVGVDDDDLDGDDLDDE